MCKISQLAEKNTGQLAIRRAYRTGALFFIIRAYLTLLLRLTKRVVIVLSSFPTEDALFNCVEGKAHDTREINCGWREPKSFYDQIQNFVVVLIYLKGNVCSFLH